jgi:hypothetical protein
MSDNVVEFPKPAEPKILVCTACRSEAFWLYQDGRVQCMRCDTFDHDVTGCWSPIAQEPPP